MRHSSKEKKLARERRHRRVRRKITGTPERPRVSVYRSLHHIYAQIIDDVSGKTLLSVSSLKKGLKGNIEAAKQMGTQLGELAKTENIKEVVFDRGGCLFHGRIKAFAEAARKSGLVF